MSKHDDGGRAFPFSYETLHPEEHCINGGMTLRDYFAAAALIGIEASQGNGGAFVSTVEKVAARAYELADAMLKERAK